MSPVASLAATRRASVAAIAIACALVPSLAHADDDVDVTEVNLNKARKLMESRSTLNEACKWLETAYRMTQRGDMLMNLAECHRRQGRNATAWIEFDKSIRIGAQVKFPEAVATATKLRDQLAQHLSRVTVSVSPAVAALPGLVVELDGKPLPPAGFNQPGIHDPGAVDVTASAKGYKKFTAHVDLGADSDAKTIDVTPEIEPPPPPLPPPPPPPPAPPSASKWPWIVGGAGVGLGVAAVLFELSSKSAGSKLDTLCGVARDDCQPGSSYEGLRGQELRGFGFFVGLGVASVAAMGTGATVLVLRKISPSAGQTSLHVTPSSFSIQSTF